MWRNLVLFLRCGQHAARRDTTLHDTAQNGTTRRVDANAGLWGGHTARGTVGPFSSSMPCSRRVDANPTRPDPTK
mgnify:CR=1 FL=1